MDPFTILALAALYCGKGVASEIKRSFSSGNSSSNKNSSTSYSTNTTASSSQSNSSACQTDREKKAENCVWQPDIKLSNKNKTK